MEGIKVNRKRRDLINLGIAFFTINDISVKRHYF